MKTSKLLIMVMVIMCLGSVFMTSAFAVESSSALRLEFISQTPDPVEPGNFVELRWRVINEGGKTEDYTFNLNLEYPFSLGATSQSTITRTIQGFQSGSAQTDVLYFRVRVADDAVQGDDNSVRLSFQKVGSSQGGITVEENIRVQSREGLVEISSVRLEPEEITIGSKFKVFMTIKNLGSSAVSNVKVTVDTEDTGFTPIGSSNQRIISLIPGNGQSVIELEYFADGTTNTEVYAIPITAAYTDSIGRSNTLETEIGFPISAKPYYLYNLEDTEIYTAGTQGQIITSISNVGKSDINFVVLELEETEDYIVLSTPKTYLGNLESDDFETGQYDIFVKDTTAESIPLVFTARYRDAYDKTYADTFSIDLRLFDQDQAENFGLVKSQSNGGGIIIAVIIIALVGFFWYRSRKKSKNKEKK